MERSFKAIYIAVVAMFVLGATTTYFAYELGKINGQQEVAKDYSLGKLNGCALKLPDSLNTIKDMNDSEPDYFIGYRDPVSNTIVFRYDSINYRDKYHEYQLELEPDSIEVFSCGNTLGKIRYGDSPLDSLLAEDNQ